MKTQTLLRSDTLYFAVCTTTTKQAYCRSCD